ncbi:MAG: hypothetical protein Q9162_000527 [Coniocarpon cinnabarinum]
MSRTLWRYYLEDDVESFCELLQRGGGASSVPARTETALSFSKSSAVERDVLNHWSPTSPVLKGKTSAHREASKQPVSLNRADINARDGKGLTILHHAASSTAGSAKRYAFALLSHPLIDLYVQDYENGWTALHRAFYFGNITIARAIIERDAPNADNISSATSQRATLARVKDREGYGPYDLFSTTIADRSLRTGLGLRASDDDDSSDDVPDTTGTMSERDGADPLNGSIVPPTINVRADEFYTFGSNKNLTLGLGNQDDRQYPERIHLKRPLRLFERFHRQHIASKISKYAVANPAYAAQIKDGMKSHEGLGDLPDVVRYRPAMIQDVQMSKFHTAVLTTDPVANLYVCGHGPGGRLGTGNENTLFNFTCLDQFGSSRVSAVALGQDHTLAVTDKGELYAWGNNMHGQLGCGLQKESPKPEEAILLSPKQIFGPMKKEVIVGVAASRIHSVAHTGNALFTFGKNEGQLGLVDSQAATLKVQSTPRHVHASRLSSNIHSISAIDRATIILLENHEVHIFANYGAVKLHFPLESFSNYFLQNSFSATKYDKKPNQIVKVTGGGDTICALSTSGEVYTVTVNQRFDPSSVASTSTTNPSKIRSAISVPHRAWTLRNDRTSARDVGVDADGSIILSTEAGGVFRRIRRPKMPGAQRGTGKDQKSKEFKFARVPNLTRAVGVRASSSGAYCAFREDCNVTRDELIGGTRTLWQDVFSMFPLRSLAEDSPAPSFWQRPDAIKRVIERIAHSPDIEVDIADILRKDPPNSIGTDILIGSTAFDCLIPAHQVILSGRSPVFRQAFAAITRSRNYVSETFNIYSSGVPKPKVIFAGLDFLTVLELIVYIYADALVGFWRSRHQSPEMTFRYKQVRTELMRVSARLELRNLETAARKVISRPEPSMTADFELARLDTAFFANCDTRVQLADGEVLVHSKLMSKRCPFFEGLFQGQADGRWLASRRHKGNDAIQVDLSHIELHVFKLVLRYLYADTDEEMFDDVITNDLDEFLDLVLEVLSVANELMLDNLSRSCQAVLGRYVTTRNACQLLNAVAPSSVQDFKNVTLEYLCLNLEPLLANHWLDELDEDLLEELDEVVRENQQAVAPFVRSGRLEAQLHEKYPELAGIIIRAQQAKIDALDVQVKYPDATTPVRGSLSQSRSSPLVTPSDSTVRTPSTAKKVSSPDTLDPLPSPAQSATLPRDDSDPVVSATDNPSVLGNRPWGPAPLTCAKLDMKDIMAQTSSGRISNLSIGLQAHDHSGRRTSGPATPKVSQKERKRQHHQQQDQKRSVSDQIPSTPFESSVASSTPSPWKTVSSTANESPGQSKADLNPVPSPSSQSNFAASRPTFTPQLTMRQTVANVPASRAPGETSKSPSTPKQTPTPARTTGPPAQTPNSAKANSSGESPTVTIRSIRHQPREGSSQDYFMNQSLSDIMSREQAEKTNLKDAVAKRSLQEIQEEQAFQEWWDKESAAVQEAQQTSDGRTSRRSRGTNTRGRGRSKRGGKQRNAGGESGANSQS